MAKKTMRERVRKHVCDMLLRDARGQDELLKELWESCGSQRDIDDAVSELDDVATEIMRPNVTAEALYSAMQDCAEGHITWGSIMHVRAALIKVGWLSHG